jgi:hypothetical protein
MQALTAISTAPHAPTAGRRNAACGLSLIFALTPALGVADEAACKPLFDAMTHLFNTPSHQFVQTSSATGGKPQKSEIINTGKVMYVMVDSQWRVSPITAAQMQVTEETSRKNAKVTDCKVVRDESVDGVAATLFSSHTETDYGASDQQIWLAKATGLPVHETIDMDLGEKAGKSHVDVRVVYASIQAPASVVPN